jgi:acetyl/propionyl-CoA carboxylase alpha subunit
MMKNESMRNNQLDASKRLADEPSLSTVYVTIEGTNDEPDQDLQVTRSCSNGKVNLTVKDLQSGEVFSNEINQLDYEHNSLIHIQTSEENFTVQSLGNKNDLMFDFHYQGGRVKTRIYDENQFKYKGHMAPPVKVDHSRSILSPMPGSIVSVSVEPGQTVVDGQDLCIVEAMKMQNVLKSERDGVIKSVNIKGGDTVTVDQLLIEFE